MAQRQSAALHFERLKSSTDPSDRLEALEQLLELSEEEPYDVGNGIPALMDTLRDCTGGRLGGDAASTVLDILENLINCRGGATNAAIAAAANTARLVDSHENLVALFDVLDSKTSEVGGLY